MIDRCHALPIARQAKALGISQGSFYYLPRPAASADLRAEVAISMDRKGSWRAPVAVARERTFTERCRSRRDPSG
jgi:hypothetical protein